MYEKDQNQRRIFNTKTPMISFVQTQEEMMGGWIVSRTIDDGEPISYKFTPKFVLRGGQSVTVSRINRWSVVP
jgi:nitrogen fixation protein FixH